jgi:hypothetical protein
MKTQNTLLWFMLHKVYKVNARWKGRANLFGHKTNGRISIKFYTGGPTLKLFF